jgi:hypothetical protein
MRTWKDLKALPAKVAAECGDTHPGAQDGRVGGLGLAIPRMTDQPVLMRKSKASGEPWNY